MPVVSALVVSVAWPAVSGPVPRLVAPSVKVTVPLEMPEPGVTVAVKVTAWPAVDGFALDASAVPVGATVTVWMSGALVTGAKPPKNGTRLGACAVSPMRGRPSISSKVRSPAK